MQSKRNFIENHANTVDPLRDMPNPHTAQQLLFRPPLRNYAFEDSPVKVDPFLGPFQAGSLRMTCQTQSLVTSLPSPRSQTDRTAAVGCQCHQHQQPPPLLPRQSLALLWPRRAINLMHFVNNIYIIIYALCKIPSIYATNWGILRIKCRK